MTVMGEMLWGVDRALIQTRKPQINSASEDPNPERPFTSPCETVPLHNHNTTESLNISLPYNAAKLHLAVSPSRRFLTAVACDGLDTAYLDLPMGMGKLSVRLGPIAPRITFGFLIDSRFFFFSFDFFTHGRSQVSNLLAPVVLGSGTGTLDLRALKQMEQQRYGPGTSEAQDLDHLELRRVLDQ